MPPPAKSREPAASIAPIAKLSPAARESPLNVAERQRLESAVLTAAERECQRLGRQLHDQLCQQLLGASFAARALAGSLPADSPHAADAGELAQLINAAVLQTRDLVRGLNPAELDAGGLRAALEELVRRPRAGAACRLECPEPVRLPTAEAARHAYRIAEEAVANAVQHAGAQEVVVRLRTDGPAVRLEISDDGAGLPPDTQSGGRLGLEMMKYRAQALGGTLRFDTPAKGGTTVICVVPKRK